MACETRTLHRSNMVLSNSDAHKSFSRFETAATDLGVKPESMT